MRHVLILVVMWGLGFGCAQELSVWTHLQGDALLWLEQEITRFSQNFNVTVSLEQRDISDIKQNLLNNPHDAADIILPLAHDQIDNLIADDILLDFKPFSTSTYVEGYAPQSSLAFQRDSSLFALPLYIEGAALIINQSLLAEAPQSFQDFQAKALELNNNDHYGFLYDIGNFYLSYLWIRSMGGYIFARNDNGNISSNDIGLANNPSLEGVKLLQDFCTDGGILAIGLPCPELDYSLTDQYFSEGKVAMIYTSSWALAGYQQAGIPLIVAPMPVPEHDDTSLAGFMTAYGVGVNATRDNHLSAIDFAKWIARERSQQNLAQTTGYIPARLAAAEASGDALVLGFARALIHAEPIPYVEAMDRVWAPMSQVLNTVLEDTHTGAVLTNDDIANLLNNAVEEIRQ